jgi:hypothetical protein
MGFKAPLQKVEHPRRFLAIFTDLFRFARHQSFMYLVYDVLQLRRSSFDNSLLVKRCDRESAERDIASLTVDQLQEAAKAVSEGRLVTTQRFNAFNEAS